MQLSKHFKLKEFTKSQIAARNGINNTPHNFEIAGVANIQVAYWVQANCDFDQLILEFYKPEDGAAGWVHVSYNEKGANRKQVLTFDGKSYSNGLPEMKWKKGEVVE